MHNDKKKMLITGVSGLLGGNLAYYFKDSYDVVGLYCSHPVTLEGVQTCKMDITSQSSLNEVLRLHNPDVIIHCASATDVDQCEINRDFTDGINVAGTRALVESIVSERSKLVYISTDSVYDGSSGNCSEVEDVSPCNYYGLSKYRGEQEALKRDGSLVLRTNIFGWNIRDKQSIAEWILCELKRNECIDGFQDAYFSSIYTFELAQVIDDALGKDLRGIFNCGSHDALSKHDFAVLIADRFGLEGNLIRPISIDDHSFIAPRGKNLSMNMEKIERSLGNRLPTIRDSVEAFFNDCEQELPQELRAAAANMSGSPISIPYGKQAIDREDIEAVVQVLQSSNLTQGPKIPEFEAALSAEVDALHSIALNSGTSALHVACLAAGVGNGDEVITSPNTFVASANCAAYCGATPVFADIDSDTYNVSPQKIEEKITKRTKAIIPVHFAGQSCDMAAIDEIRKRAEDMHGHRIYIIEDACHALGSLYKSQKVGSCTYSDMTVMSFHPVKHITTGEGGAIFTNDDELNGKLRLYRSHGITGDVADFNDHDMAFQAANADVRNPWYYEQIALGYNYRITDIQCILGVTQLKRLGAFRKRRRAIVNRYNEAFKNLENVKIPSEASECDSNFHLYVLLFDFDAIGLERARFMETLKGDGVQSQVHYIPVHLQPYYRKHFGTNWGNCPNAEEYYKQCLSIPLFPGMTDGDVDKVIQDITNLVKGA